MIWLYHIHWRYCIVWAFQLGSYDFFCNYYSLQWGKTQNHARSVHDTTEWNELIRFFHFEITLVLKRDRWFQLCVQYTVGMLFTLRSAQTKSFIFFLRPISFLLRSLSCTHFLVSVLIPYQVSLLKISWRRSMRFLVFTATADHVSSQWS